MRRRAECVAFATFSSLFKLFVYIVYHIYTVSRKKRDQNVFVISPIKLWPFWWNLVHRFLDKFVSKWCKPFPFHLNNVSTLPCEIWNTHCTHAIALSCYRRHSRFLLQLWTPYSPDLKLVDNSIWEMLQEKVYKTRITALELLTTPLTNGFRNDDIAQL